MVIGNICQAQFQDYLIQDKFSTICYIESNVPQTLKENKTEYELLLRNGDKIKPYTKRYSGTGFIVEREIDLYLVTATHVAINTNPNSLIAFRSNSGESKLFDLRKIAGSSDKWWYHHPEGDISVIRIDPELIEKEKCFKGHDMYFINNSNPPDDRSIEITVIGFPLGIGFDVNNIEPISKTNRISSGQLRIPRFDNKVISRMFLVDDPSTSGFSGAPVFITDEEFYSAPARNDRDAVKDLIGVVHGTINDKKDGKFGAITISKLIIDAIENCGGSDGIQEFTYNNGDKWAKIEIKNGSPFNVIYNLDKEGNPNNPGTLKNGTGTMYRFNEDSTISGVFEYLNGKLISSKIYPYYEYIKDYDEK